MEQEPYTSLFSILIPVLISIVGTVPALFTYLNNRPSAEQKRKQLAEAELTFAEKDKVEISSMSAVMEATNLLLIAPLKQRILELEAENSVLRDKVDKLECENAENLFELKKAQREMKEAMRELQELRRRLAVLETTVDEKNGESK